MGSFREPAGVSVDGEGNIYIADWGNERVQVLGPDGGFLAKFRGESGLSKWGESYFIANQDELEERQKANLEPELHLSPTDDLREESASIEKFFWGPTAVKVDDKAGSTSSKAAATVSRCTVKHQRKSTTGICPATLIERLVSSARCPVASSPSICSAQPPGSASWNPLTRLLSNGQECRKGGQYRERTKRAKCHGRVTGVTSNRPSPEPRSVVNGAPPAYDGTLLTITALAPGGIVPAVQPFSGVSSCQERLGKRVVQYRNASRA